MDRQIHQNFIRSSNLIFGTIGLGLINLFFLGDLLSDDKDIAIIIFTTLVIIVTGFLVRKGEKWVKYLLLILTIGGLIGIPTLITNIIEQPILGLINIVQTAMQLWATILLFKIPKRSPESYSENIVIDNGKEPND